MSVEAHDPVKVQNNILGECGEYYVAAYLSGLDLVAALTRGARAPTTDIILTTLTGSRSASIQVKTAGMYAHFDKKRHRRRASGHGTQAQSRARFNSPSYWYAFVYTGGWPQFENIPAPRIYFVPSPFVAKRVLENSDDDWFFMYNHEAEGSFGLKGYEAMKIFLSDGGALSDKSDPSSPRPWPRSEADKQPNLAPNFRQGRQEAARGGRTNTHLACNRGNNPCSLPRMGSIGRLRRAPNALDGKPSECAASVALSPCLARGARWAAVQFIGLGNCILLGIVIVVNQGAAGSTPIVKLHPLLRRKRFDPFQEPFVLCVNALSLAILLWRRVARPRGHRRLEARLALMPVASLAPAKNADQALPEPSNGVHVVLSAR